jgi:CheY-like chemotaxis protein
VNSKKYQILLVDDVADNLSLLKAFLELEGYTVETAENGSVALEKMRDSVPDLVLLDVMMPGMDGYAVTKAIRRNDRLRTVPIVLITAHIDACRIKGLAVGATDFIRKPIVLEELLANIQRILNFRG